MPKTKFHMAWFVSRGYGPKAWRLPWGGPDPQNWTKPDLFVDLARAMERTCFDYIMIEDSSNVPYTYQNSHDTYLRLAVDSPKLDPAVLAPFMMAATRHLGIVTTLATFEYHPFLLARLTNTLDHVSDGRAGWNLVTGSNDGGAQNYGLKGQYQHDERYEMADDYCEAVTRLWESWEPGAVVLDQERAIFADPTKVHPVHYQGKYFSTRGPLSAPRSPQGRPVICQAGGSPRGRTFAARWADTVIGSASSVDGMKAFRDDIRAQAASFGRDPDSLKILFLVAPIVDEFRESAMARRDAQKADAAAFIEWHLASSSRLTGIDFSKFDLDEPLPELDSNGHRTLAAAYAGRTLREIAGSGRQTADLDLNGTACEVAARLSEMMDAIGGDGFLIMNGELTRRYVTEITDGLIPALQRLGVVRTRYEHALFRDNLLAF